MRLRMTCFAAVAGGSFIFLASTIAHAVTIFSDFGPGNTFQTNSGTAVSGPTSSLGIAFAPAMPFSSLIDANVTQIDIALSNVNGTNAATVNLFADAGGSLGTLLGSFLVGSFGPFGSAVAITTISGISGVHLNAGGNYFLQAAAATDAFNSWNTNSVGASGTVLIFRSDEGFVQQVQDLGAFDIIGDITAASATALPAALPMFAGGLGALSLLGWRRKKKTALAA